jgi:hypothetical protein
VAILRVFCLPLLVATTLAATALPRKTTPPLRSAVPFCTMLPGSTLALISVEKDTTLPFALERVEPMSFSGVRESPRDSLLATTSTLMPAARVRLLQLDSSSRAILATEGITDSQPVALIRAAPYRSDCRTIRWTDTVPFVERGEVGFLRGTLAPRERWIDGVPVLVVPDVWNYPYPRRRALAFRVAPDAPLASAAAIFSLNVVLEMPRPVSLAARIADDSTRRRRAIAWARANPVSAELEPARSLVRRAVLDPDWKVAERAPSRLRGTYRVDVESGGERGTWFFRTYNRPGYRWPGGDSLQTTAGLLASPHVAGYSLVGYTAGSPDSIPAPSPRGPMHIPLVWLAVSDRPTTAGNDARRALFAVLEFTLRAAPQELWDDLEPLVPRLSASDSALFGPMTRPSPRGQKQPRIPLTIRLDERGGVRADTTLIVGTRSVRVILERVDTLSFARPW